ncbi:MAG: hypothetical protein QOD83_5031, partial [Solirubrobacteraceae bacterium]|nr:hypothetical protein [Solirubrobacteraceae bacterium]
MTADDLDRHYRHLLEQAVTRLDASEAALAAASRAASEPLAIVGAACRLPGGIDSTDALRAALHTATDAVTEVPAERWSNDEYCDPDPEAAGFTCSRWGGFLDDVAGFEPAFFGLTPREAQHMDPQQRLLLELAWHALEDACIPVSGLAGSDTGVAIGISSHDYFDLSTRERTQIGPFTGAGTSVSVAAGRLAYGFGFQGPALAVDTACSSSLAAVHIACTMLRGGECDLALAGGVHLQLTPALRLIESRLGAHSPSGRCRSFDAHADGIVTSEGAGLVVLERLSDARANGHRIRALVRGSAVNQDGRSSGLTVPNGPAQEAVLRSALRRAGIAPASVGYVEAHGAGTPLGDPIEAGALSAVYGAGRPRDAPVPIGSIKSNIGHLGAAAGIAGLLKVLVAIEHGRIPTQLHCDEPTPAVDWDSAGLRVVTEECALEPAGDGRVAAISSFGFSGTNAHAILQEAPAAAAGAAAPDAGVHLLALSARTLPALTAQVTRLRRHLAATPIALADLCHSANLGRDHFARRAAFVVRTPDELDAALGSFDSDDVVDGPARAPRVAFVFPGQGNQYGRMAQELLATEPVFRAAIDRCDAALGGLVPRSLAALLDTDEHDPDLHRTSVLQPLLVGLGYALSECWAAWGVRPAWVLGHSAGELSAACAAGVLPLRDALSLAVARGRLMETLTVEGGMALVTCDRTLLDDVLDRHGPRVAIAGYNGPRQWVLSSECAALDDCLAELAGAGAGVRVLPGAIPGHTPHMTPIADGMRAAASAVNASAPQCRFASTLTGRIEDEAMTRPGYWVDEVLQPVRFRQAVDSVVADGCDIFLELGPGASLVSMVAEWVTDRTLLTSLQRGKRPAEHLHRGLAELYRRGCAVDWQSYCSDRGGRFVGLPGYAFQRERCWLPDAPQRFSPTAAGVATNGAAAPAHALLGHARTTVLAQPGQALYEQVLRSSAPAYLCDHRVGGHVVYPAAAFVEMALAAARTGMRSGAIHLRDIAIDRALLLGDEHVTVQTLVEEVAPQTLRVRVFSAPGDGAEGWIAHFEAYVTAHEPPVPALDGWAVPGDASAGALREHYERMAAGGLTAGASFRAIRGLEAGLDGGTVRLKLPLQAGGADGYCLHPVLLDASLQGASLVLGDAGAGLVYLPTGIDALSLLSEPGDELVCHAARRPAGACERAADGEVVIDA